MIDHNHFICHFIFGGHLLNIPRIIQNKKGHNFIQVVAFSTGREARTPDTRFWRPMLYQLSYSRVCGCKSSINFGNRKRFCQIFYRLFLTTKING